MWQSKAPTAMAMPAGRPSLSAHSGTKGAGRGIGCVGILIEPAAQVRQRRIQTREEINVGQTIPIGVEHRLVAGGTDGSF